MVTLRIPRLFGAVLAAGVLLGMPLATRAEEPTTVRFDAVFATGGEVVNDAMSLAVWALDDDAPQQGKVAERHAAPAEVALAPGRYRIEAIYDNLRRVQDIQVGSDSYQRVRINLRAGELALNLLPRVGEQPIKSPLAWDVRRYTGNGKPGQRVAAKTHKSLDLLLSEGWYKVAVAHNGKTVEHLVEVDAGRRYEYSLLLDE